LSSYALTMMSGSIDSRSRTDRRLYFWKDLILLPIVTIGIWGLVVLYRLISRRDEHFRRESGLYTNLLQALKERIQAKGIDPLSMPEMAALESAIRQKEEREQPKGAALWLILNMVSGGLAGIYVHYFLTVDFYHHQQREIELANKINMVLSRAGSESSIRYEPVIPERHFWLNLLVCFVTLGFWAIVWQYRVLSDGNRHFESQWVFEDGLSSLVSSI
jgi:hypothetical protein